jgi:hypothetical protein
MNAWRAFVDAAISDLERARNRPKGEALDYLREARESLAAAIEMLDDEQKSS